MESIGSSSTPANHHPPPPTRHRLQPTSDRIVRALRHPLRLLHRADSLFFVLGATGNVYTVAISASPSCTCPDRAATCKHILFVLIRALGLPLDDPCLWRRTLRLCQVRRLLALPVSGDALAGAAAREVFHRMFFRRGGDRTPPTLAAAEGGGGACPVCLEEMGRGDRVVACGTCKNVVHEECFLAWKKSCGRRRTATCVLCRARWRIGGSGGGDGEKYLNLSAYVDVDDGDGDGVVVVEGEGDVGGRCR